MTKTLMARNIIMALYNLPALPSEDNVNVQRKAKNNRKHILEYQFELANKALKSIGREWRME